MSFGEGDLHERCEMYRKQLGGMTAANNRLKEELSELSELVRDMWKELCDLEGSYEENGYSTSLPEFEQRVKAMGIEV